MAKTFRKVTLKLRKEFKNIKKYGMFHLQTKHIFSPNCVTETNNMAIVYSFYFESFYLQNYMQNILMTAVYIFSTAK